MPCLHDSLDSIPRATFPCSIPHSTKRKPCSPFPAPVPAHPPLILLPLQLRIRCLIGSFRLAPIPYPFPHPLHHIDSHPAFPLPCHTVTPGLLPYQLQAARQRGEERNLFVGRGAMALPRPTHTALARLSHIKRNPHTTRETAPCHFCYPHPLHYPCLSHTPRETSLPTLGSSPLPAPSTSLVSPPSVPITPCDTPYTS